jgi:hypothetical protein
VSPSAALRRLPAGADRGTRRISVLPIVAAAVVAVILFALVQLVSVPGVVGHVTVMNPTRYQLEVEVTDAARDGWTAVGSVDARSALGAEEVYDVGDTWTFRFTSQGLVSKDVTFTRDELERGGWRLQVPRSVGDELRVASAPSPP